MFRGASEHELLVVLLLFQVLTFTYLYCRAIKNGKGLHSKKEVPIHRVADISGVCSFFALFFFRFN